MVRISLCLLSPDMYCIVFSCVIYYRLKAFKKKRENKTLRKNSHSTVMHGFCMNVSMFSYSAIISTGMVSKRQSPSKLLSDIVRTSIVTIGCYSWQRCTIQLVSSGDVKRTCQNGLKLLTDWLQSSDFPSLQRSK